MSPVNIVLSYAWYFQKDRYDWSFEITGNLKEYNKKFPTGHAVGPEHARAILSEPQTAFHVPYEMWLWPKVLLSYCLSHRVNPEFRSGESAQGESCLVWLSWLIIYARWYKAESLYSQQRFAKGVQRNTTNFLNASITTDGEKIFSITFCTVVTIYCTCK